MQIVPYSIFFTTTMYAQIESGYFPPCVAKIVCSIFVNEYLERCVIFVDWFIFIIRR